MTTDGELWHFVEAKRDDGMPTMFNIRELEPKRQLTKIFVVELPYPKTAPACLPCAADFRRQASFDEQWLRPACGSLGWELVGSKIEDGSFYFYMYGAGDPTAMIARLSPFDGGLGFYDDDDPTWSEYGTLRDLLDQAKAIPAQRIDAAPPPAPAPAPARVTTVIARPKVKANARARTAAPKPKARATSKAKASSKPKARAKSEAKPAPKAKVKPVPKAKAKPAPKVKASQLKAGKPKLRAQPKPAQAKRTQSNRNTARK